MAGNLLPPKRPEALQPLPDENALGPLEPGTMGGFEQDEGGIQWGRYIAALKRYKWLMLAVIAVGTALGYTATRYLKPEYLASATVWIELPANERGAVQAGPVVEGQNWVELVTTFLVLDSVVMKERLYFQPADPADSAVFRNFKAGRAYVTGNHILSTDETGRNYTLKTREGIVTETGVLGGPVGRKIGVEWTPDPKTIGPDREIKFSLVSPRDASTALRQQLVPMMAQNGNFLRLSLRGEDPVRLTNTLNTLVTHYVEVAAQLKRQQLTEQKKALEEQYRTVAESLSVAERRLEGFKTRTITQPSEGVAVVPGLGVTQNPVMAQYFGERMQAEQLQRDQQALNRVIERSRAGALPIDELANIPSVKTSIDIQQQLAELTKWESELRNATYRYTDQSKQVQDIRAKIDTLRGKAIPAAAANLAAALRQQQQTLQTSLSSASSEIRAMPGRTINEQKLTRERDAWAQFSVDMQSRLQVARLAEASAIPDVRVHDPAVQPTRPSSNNAAMIIAGAFFGSLGLAIGLALLLDRMDKRFRYPDQVTRELGLGILGAVPGIRKVRADERDPEEASQVVEAFRTVRMNLAHSYGAAGPVMLTVSSPGPGDGKSFVSSNLALSFAEAGYRTLLIDGDIRRGELHRMFDTDRRPGLLDYLLGQAQMEQVLRASTHKNLTVIPCGTRHHHGPELLGSPAMREMIADLKQRYNVIIIDSPPLGAGIDPFVLGTATGNIMLVLRSGETDRNMAEAKLKLLDRLPVRILGAVLNDISTADNAYRHYKYVYEYTPDEESAQLASGTGA